VPRRIDGVPDVVARGQGGLLDVVTHPDYDTNGWIYLAFSKPFGNGAHTSIVRGRLEGDRLTGIETVYDPPADQAAASRRLSLVFFHNPNYDAPVSALPGTVGNGAAPRFAPTTSGEHLRAQFVKTQVTETAT
jgi:hypothetical protein